MIQPCHFSGPWWKQEKNTSRKNCSRQRDYYLKNKEYHVHPEGWDKSYIGTFSALTNLLTYGDLNKDQISLAENNLQDLQEKFIKRFDTLSDQLRKEKSMEAREEIMTKAEVKALLDSLGTKYAQAGGWDAQADSEELAAACDKLFQEGKAINFITWKEGTVLNGGSGSEHMASFDYAYKLEKVRDWLFEQKK